MGQLLKASLAFPTVVLTILVGIALVYWIFVILGALDIDLVADADVDVDGALDGAGDIGDVGGDIGDAGGDIGDAGDAGDAGGDADGHVGSAGILAALGLRAVPMTISFSLIFLFAWIICMIIMLAIGDFDSVPRWLLGTGVLLGSLFLALPPAALCAKPIAPLFVIHEAKKRQDYVGSVCTVMTGEVTNKFGQARIQEGGYVLEVQVRCEVGERFKRQDQALIIEFDREREVYLIEPMDEVMGKKKKED